MVCDQITTNDDQKQLIASSHQTQVHSRPCHAAGDEFLTPVVVVVEIEDVGATLNAHTARYEPATGPTWHGNEPKGISTVYCRHVKLNPGAGVCASLSVQAVAALS
jgi:hypothetical protein